MALKCLFMNCTRIFLLIIKVEVLYQTPKAKIVNLKMGKFVIFSLKHGFSKIENCPTAAILDFSPNFFLGFYYPLVGLVNPLLKVGPGLLSPSREGVQFLLNRADAHAFWLMTQELGLGSKNPLALFHTP